MYAISVDLVVADTTQNHPKGVSQAYADIGSTLNKLSMTLIAFKAAYTPANMKTWPICFQPSMT